MDTISTEQTKLSLRYQALGAAKALLLIAVLWGVAHVARADGNAASTVAAATDSEPLFCMAIDVCTGAVAVVTDSGPTVPDAATVLRGQPDVDNTLPPSF